MMAMDMIAAASGVIGATGCCAVYEITSPRHPRWPTVPMFVRLGWLVAGAFLLFRAIDLGALSFHPGPGAHVDVWGLASWVTLSYLFATNAYNLIFWRYPILGTPREP